MTGEYVNELTDALKKLQEGTPARTLFDVNDDGIVFLISNPNVYIKEDSVVSEQIKNQISKEYEELFEETERKGKELASKLSDSSIDEKERLEVIKQLQDANDVIEKISVKLDKLSNKKKNESEIAVVEYGERSAEDLVSHKEKESKTSDDEKQKSFIYTLSDEFIWSDIKEEELNVTGNNIKNRISLIAQHTGQKISADDKVLAVSYNKYASQFRANLDILPKSVVRDYKKRYGEDWKEAVMASYKQGWDRQMQIEIDSAYEKGVELREKLQPKKGKEEPTDVTPEVKSGETKPEIVEPSASKSGGSSKVEDAMKKVIELQYQTIGSEKTEKEEMKKELLTVKESLDSAIRENAAIKEQLSLSEEEVKKLKKELQQANEARAKAEADAKMANQRVEYFVTAISQFNAGYGETVPPDEEKISPKQL